MITGSLPPATIWGTWSENIEVWSVDDDTLMDLTSVAEATLKLRDPDIQFDELTLTLSNGDITFPSTGIIQWHVSQSMMSRLISKEYKVILTLEHIDGDIVVLVLGSISILE